MNLQEKGQGKENIGVVQSRGILERAFEHAVWKIGRWASEADKKAGKIYSKKEALKLFGVPQFTSFERNCLLNEGINEFFTLVCSASGTKFDNTNAQTGVGDSTVAEAVTQTDLQAATNKAYVGMMAGFPTYGTDQKAIWKSSYDGNTANYAWQEFVVRNGATALKDICRKVSAQGNKASGLIKSLARLKSLLINGEYLRRYAMATLTKLIEKIKNSILQVQRLSEETLIIREATVRTYAKA